MRPHYHYAAAANWLSDPNGLVHHDGEWHLFYQYNPQGEDWGHMSWGHAVSADLAHWRELPVAIEDDTDAMIFSGSAVVDHAGRAGFGVDAMVALYTAASAKGPQHQSQALAWSSDKGRTWTKYDGNPVIDRGLADFRDPNVFWHAPTERWIMVVVLSAEHRALIYASRDLKLWDELSVIDGTGAPGRIWECPLLIELPVEGSARTRWMFKVDALHDGPGSGAIYCTGMFDGIRFVPDGAVPNWQVADWGRDFYAAIAWHEPRDEAGRPVWIGWLGNHGYQGALPRQGWRGAMSLPRRLSLIPSDMGWTLRQEAEAAAIANVPVANLKACVIAAASRLVLPTSHDCLIAINDRAGRSIRIARRAGLVTVSRTDPVTPALDGESRMTVAVDARVEIWLDTGSCEILAAGALGSLTIQHRLQGSEWRLLTTFEAGEGQSAFSA